MIIGNPNGSGTGALTIYPNSITGNGRLDIYGGGDENAQSASKNEVMRIGRGDILDQYYHSIWSATGSGGSTSHFLKFYVSNGNAGATNQLEALSMNGNGQVQIIQTTQSTSKDTGALVVEGGVGIEKNVYVGGALNVTGNTNLSAELRANANIRMTNAGPKITFVDSNNDSDYEIGNADGVFRIRDTTNSANRFVVTSGGDVGLGNDSPNCRLAVKDTTDALTAYANVTPSVGDCMAQLYYNPSSETVNDHATLQFGINGGSHNRVNTISAVAESASNRKLAFTFCTDSGSNRNERMRITGDGNIGIGVIPAAQLHLGGPSEIRFNNATDAGNFAKIQCFEESGNNHAILAFSVGAGEALRIKNSGEVHMGTSSPTTSNVSADDLVLGNTAGSTNRGMTIWSHSS